MQVSLVRRCYEFGLLTLAAKTSVYTMSTICEVQNKFLSAACQSIQSIAPTPWYLIAVLKRCETCTELTVHKFKMFRMLMSGTVAVEEPSVVYLKLGSLKSKILSRMGGRQLCLTRPTMAPPGMLK